MSKYIDITEFPVSELRKSKTYCDSIDECGQCSKCYEWCGLLDPCCSASVYYQGSTSSYEDLWQAIEDELIALAIPTNDKIEIMNDEKD